VNKDGIIFCALIIIISYFANTLPKILETIMTPVLVCIAILVGIKLLSKIANAFPDKGNHLKAALTKLPGGYEIKTYTLPKSMKEAVSFVINKISTPEDNWDTLDQKFASLIDVGNFDDKPLPLCYKGIIQKKILWEYFKKYGNLKGHVFNHNTIEFSDVVRPIEKSETQEFINFCCKH
jgi:hypothetical protein